MSKQQRLTVYVDDQFRAVVRHCATDDGSTVSGFVRSLVERHVVDRFQLGMFQRPPVDITRCSGCGIIREHGVACPACPGVS